MYQMIRTCHCMLWPGKLVLDTLYCNCTHFLASFIGTIPAPSWRTPKACSPRVINCSTVPPASPSEQPVRDTTRSIAP